MEDHVIAYLLLLLNVFGQKCLCSGHPILEGSEVLPLGLK